MNQASGHVPRRRQSSLKTMSATAASLWRAYALGGSPNTALEGSTAEPMVWCRGPEFPSTASSPNFEHWCLETSAVIILHLPNTQKVQGICLSKLTFETITSNRKRSVRFPCHHLLFRILGLQSLWARVSETADYQVWILRVAQTIGETHRQHSCLNTSPASPHPRPPSLHILSLTCPSTPSAYLTRWGAL